MDGELTKIAEHAQKAADHRQLLAEALIPLLKGFTYDPGHSDLDNEQPITLHVTLGDFRRAERALRKCL